MNIGGDAKGNWKVKGLLDYNEGKNFYPVIKILQENISSHSFDG
jgi:hypothetical protein